MWWQSAAGKRRSPARGITDDEQGSQDKTVAAEMVGQDVGDRDDAGLCVPGLLGGRQTDRPFKTLSRIRRVEGIFH